MYTPKSLSTIGNEHSPRQHQDLKKRHFSRIRNRKATVYRFLTRSPPAACPYHVINVINICCSFNTSPSTSANKASPKKAYASADQLAPNRLMKFSVWSVIFFRMCRLLGPSSFAACVVYLVCSPGFTSGCEGPECLPLLPLLKLARLTGAAESLRGYVNFFFLLMGGADGQGSGNVFTGYFFAFVCNVEWAACTRSSLRRRPPVWTGV